MLVLEQRSKWFINTDPQRRCYNGAFFSGERVWSPWSWLELDVDPAKAEERLVFWRELNDYAVSQRGSGARKEFRVVEKGDSYDPDIN